MLTDQLTTQMRAHQAEVHAAYQRGLRDGYERGFRDGGLHPDELQKKLLAQRTYIPKRRSDWPALEKL